MKPMRQQQRGITAVIVVMGLLALLAMVGLAVDTGHVVLNKSQLQSTVDAAALAAAKVLDATGSETQATTAARSVFDLNAAKQPELSRALSGADITVQYSNTLNPFASGSAPANYVRVFANDFTMWTSLTALVGVGDASTAATAVAGPSAPIGPGEACDLAPMMICGDPAAGAVNNWGYTGNNVTLLKIASNAPSGIGPGNYQLIRLGGPGANIVRENLAGGYDDCVEPLDTVETQPGNEVGPVAQGLNTRFGKYLGGMKAADYPPDKITTQPQPKLDVAADGVTVILKGSGTPVTSIDQISYSHDNYMSNMRAGNFTNPSGKALRRELAVPVVNCATIVNGQGTLPVLGFGCMFLLQEAEQKGTQSFVYSEFIGSCAAAGVPGPVPGPVGGPGIYKIVLHNDPASPDS